MLRREDFVSFILDGPKETIEQPAQEKKQLALPEGFEGFASEETQTADTEEVSFALRLVEASGFGPAQYLEREEVILGDDAAAKYLPSRVYYWPKINSRPYQTLLFEVENVGTEFLKAPVFRDDLKGQEILEDGLSRLVQMSLRGFERGGAKRTAAVMQGQQKETLCIISISDDRDRNNEASNLVCLGTVSSNQGSLETFHIREEARNWERQLAEDHLSRLYDRHFKKLGSSRWQDAFITGEERKLARNLLGICTEPGVSEKKIQKHIIGLLEEVAKSFGLRRKKSGARLAVFDLPEDHDIGIDSSTQKEKSLKNPFQGIILRDERNRLLGYIVYCLDKKKEARDLQSYLAQNNRFHNVLVIYPDENQAVLELWQGTRKLEGKLTKQGANYKGEGEVVNLLSRFFVVSRAKVTNPQELAEELAFRARYLRRLALRQLQEEENGGQLLDLYNSFKENLIHEHTEEEFADAYAQTLTYGLLSARWISKDNLSSKKLRFTRENAVDHLPSTSPFLRVFFNKVLKVGFEFKLTWLLEDISDLLDRTDIGIVFGNIGNDGNTSTDPVIHFYEPFLEAYDAGLRKDRGVYYTPEPIVASIVKGIDEAIQKEMGLPLGIADYSTWQKKVQKGEFKIQILDPAVGTGTFLKAIIKLIYSKMTSIWKDQQYNESKINQLWHNYVETKLLPRLFGFELMIAPYVICHLRLALVLKETGYDCVGDQCLQVHLSNTLEPAYKIQGDLFESFISEEALKAQKIKENIPISVIIGNPPYSGHSSNAGLFENEVDVYKSVEGKSLRLGQAKWLHNDYVKFIRYAEIGLEKNGGILGMITDHSYLENNTYVGLRYSLAKTFNQLTILNLHGNAKLNRNSSDNDEPVFPITQGVAIIIATRALKSDKRKESTQVNYGDLRGKIEAKFTVLVEKTIHELCSKISCDSPYYLFKTDSPIFNGGSIEDSDVGILSLYDSWSSVVDLFIGNRGSGKVRRVGTGFVSTHDQFAISWEKDEMIRKVKFLTKTKSETAAREAFRLCGTNQWNYNNAVKLLNKDQDWLQEVREVQYRPFDIRWTVWNPMVCVHRRIAANDPLCFGETALCIGQAGNVIGDSEWSLAFVSDKPVDFNLFYRGGEGVFPERLLRDNKNSTKKKLVYNIEKTFLEALPISCSEDPMAYIYAILYSPSYRRLFNNRLAVDYPRIPISKSEKLCKKLVHFGRKLINLHLLKETNNKRNPIKFKGDRMVIEKLGEKGKTLSDVRENRGRLFINKSSYFDNVEKKVWEFRIGGYQVCHKWLDSRKRNKRPLSNIDIAHFCKINSVLSTTIKIMGNIDEVIERYGGWPGAFREGSRESK